MPNAKVLSEKQKIVADLTEKIKAAQIQREQERRQLEAELERLQAEFSKTKGLFAGKRKKELEDQIMVLQARLKKL